MIQICHSPEENNKLPTKLGIQFKVSKKSLKKSSLILRKLKKVQYSSSSQSIHTNSDQFLNHKFQSIHPQRKPQILKYLQQKINKKDVKPTLSLKQRETSICFKNNQPTEIKKLNSNFDKTHQQIPKVCTMNNDFSYLKNYGTQDTNQGHKTFYSNCFPIQNPSTRYPSFIPRYHKEKKLQYCHTSQLLRKSGIRANQKLENEELPYARASSYQGFPARKKKHGVQVLVNMLIKHVRNEQRQKHMKQIKQLQQQQNRRKQLIREKSKQFKQDNNYLFTKIYFKNRKKIHQKKQ